MNAQTSPRTFGDRDGKSEADGDKGRDGRLAASYNMRVDLRADQDEATRHGWYSDVHSRPQGSRARETLVTDRQNIGLRVDPRLANILRERRVDVVRYRGTVTAFRYI